MRRKPIPQPIETAKGLTRRLVAAATASCLPTAAALALSLAACSAPQSDETIAPDRVVKPNVVPSVSADPTPSLEPTPPDPTPMPLPGAAMIVTPVPPVPSATTHAPPIVPSSKPVKLPGKIEAPRTI